MRKQTIGGITFEYPDAIAYEGDLNYVTAKATGSTATGIIATVDGKSAQYVSASDYCAVEIGSLLQSAGTYGFVTISLYLSRNNSVYSTVVDVSIYFTRGRTVPTRYHGSGRRILVPQFLSSVQLPVVAVGNVSYGAVSTIVAEPQIISMTPVLNGVYTVGYEEPQTLGDFVDAESTQEAAFVVERVMCLRSDEVYIGWYDIDGCERYAVARIMSRKRAAQSVMYASGLDIVRNLPQRIVAGVSEELEVGIVGADNALRLDEIVWSESVWLLNGNGDATPVVINGDMDVDLRKTNDIILKLNTLV